MTRCWPSPALRSPESIAVAATICLSQTSCCNILPARCHVSHAHAVSSRRGHTAGQSRAAHWHKAQRAQQAQAQGQHSIGPGHPGLPRLHHWPPDGHRRLCTALHCRLHVHSNPQHHTTACQARAARLLGAAHLHVAMLCAWCCDPVQLPGASSSAGWCGVRGRGIGLGKASRKRPGGCRQAPQRAAERRFTCKEVSGAAR